jgi:YggT family protein
VEFLFALVDWLFTLYALAFVARSILTMIRISPYHPVMNFLIQITEPLLAPLRRHIRPIGMWDVTPMAAIIILLIVEQIVKLALRMVAVP